MQKVSTYHLDQNVRGLISKNRINQSFLNKYYPEKYEAILPCAVFEYAGIPIKEVFNKIKEPELPEPLNLKKIKEYFDKKIENNLSKKDIEKKLKK